jgi:hypothetical protein
VWNIHEKSAYRRGDGIAGDFEAASPLILAALFAFSAVNNFRHVFLTPVRRI